MKHESSSTKLDSTHITHLTRLRPLDWHNHTSTKSYSLSLSLEWAALSLGPLLYLPLSFISFSHRTKLRLFSSSRHATCFYALLLPAQSSPIQLSCFCLIATCSTLESRVCIITPPCTPVLGFINLALTISLPLSLSLSLSLSFFLFLFFSLSPSADSHLIVAAPSTRLLFSPRAPYTTFPLETSAAYIICTATAISITRYRRAFRPTATANGLSTTCLFRSSLATCF